MTAAGLEQLLAAKEIVVFCGSGGVGKTSVAAAAALGAASRLGGKVLVLTIDPAKRLATALGLEGIGNHAHQVPPEVLKAAGLEPRGELWAAMLDTKQSWDDLVLRHAKDEETAYRILENRLYHNLTARFVQSHDYIAMERLYEIHASGEYDLIVIDTPPTRNAIDFLEAPARMADFFGGRLLRWLTLPYRVGGKRGNRVLNVASRPFYQMADRVLGSKFLEDIAEFFLNFQSMYDGFVHARERGRAAAARPAHDVRGRHDARSRAAARGRALLRGADRAQVPPRRARPQQDAARLPARPRRRGGGDGVRRRRRRDRRGRRRRSTTRRSTIRPASRGCCARSASRSATSRSSRCAKRSCDAELARVPDVVVRVPNFEIDIGDVDGLAEIGRHLYRRGTRA